MPDLERTEFGFARSTCACAKCGLFCRYKPGVLAPADLERLIPSGADPYTWAEEHLRAFGMVMRSLPDRAALFGPLVPARGADGACHWFQNEGCAVHTNSPFGCAFFDGCRQSREEGMLRSDRSDQAIADEWDKDTLYSRLWHHLWNRGLRERPTPQNEMQLQAELVRLNLAN